jgi:hypothetical protein
LRHSTPGNETMAVAHFFIGMEALTPIARRREMDRTGLSADDLAASWDLDQTRKLDAEVRRRILFRGDDATASKARQASDGLEHSFLDFAKVRELAEEVVAKTARYLREAILDYSDLDETHRATLKSSPFERPLRSYYTRYLWGHIVGEGDVLAEPGQEYPLVTWRSRLKSFARDENDPDRFAAQPEETMTARIAEGLTFRPRRWEIFGAASSGATAGRSDDPQVETDDEAGPT